MERLHCEQVNQDYAGHSGTVFAQSETIATLHACDWKAGVSCEWPSWFAWFKPLSRRDARKSEMAILLVRSISSYRRRNAVWALFPMHVLFTVTTEYLAVLLARSADEQWQCLQHTQLRFHSGPRAATKSARRSHRLRLRPHDNVVRVLRCLGSSESGQALWAAVHHSHRSGFARLRVLDSVGVQFRCDSGLN